MNNVLLWIVQSAAVIAVAAVLAWLLRSIRPAARLAFWQITLAAAILLPVLQPWQSEVVTAIRFAPVHVAAAAPPAPAPPRSPIPSFETFLEAAIVLGILARLTRLAIGLARLRQYRLRATPFPATSDDALILVSKDISSPVTFGFLTPIILVPTSFAALSPELQDPILRHELIHVRRKDWLFALAEETLRSLLWFHPGIWYAVREIQLVREETVDREVVAATQARQTYVDALLAIARSLKGPQMAAAPSFFRRNHLKRRVFSLFHEVTMSKPKTAASFIAACATMALACWFVTGALPLKAAPQEIQDGPGVSVDMNGARLMHRSPIRYPDGALTKGVQGTVTAQVKLDSAGNVADASISAGPEELRKAVLQSVLNWHFAGDSANGTRQVTVTFTASAVPKPQAVVSAAPQRETMFTVPPGVTVRSVPGRPIVKINAPADLLPKLPIHEGDILTGELRDQTLHTAREYDEHILMFSTIKDDGVTVNLAVPGPDLLAPKATESARAAAVSADSASTAGPKPIRVGANVQANNLISQVKPIYPPLAKMARVQGDVVFEAIIGTDGTVQNLHLLSGAPLLVQASMVAVQQWKYKPTLLNGQPVEVTTTITVSYSLADAN
jgi:TonB family protein